MSRLQFFILAALVTVAGTVIVAWATRRISKLASSRTGYVALIFLLIYAAAIILRPSLWVMIDLAVLIGAVGGALLIGRTLGSSGSVVAFLVAASVVDILSINLGISRGIIDRYQEGTSDLLLYLTLVMPISNRLVPIVGISDLLIGGSVATALINNGFKPVVAVGAIVIGFIAALGYGLWRGGAPGLPFIAITVGFLVWRSSRGSTQRGNEVSSS